MLVSINANKTRLGMRLLAKWDPCESKGSRLRPIEVVVVDMEVLRPATLCNQSYRTTRIQLFHQTEY